MGKRIVLVPHLTTEGRAARYRATADAATARRWHCLWLVSAGKRRDEAAALVGRKDRFEDQVKLTKDGLLVSRLSLNNSAKTVVAYSVCKTL